MKTMKELAQEAIDCQNASNLSGLVHAFSRSITDLRAHLEKEFGDKFSTNMVNEHPISVMFSTQIAFLTRTSGSGCENANLYRKAYEWCLAEVSKQ